MDGHRQHALKATFNWEMALRNDHLHKIRRTQLIKERSHEFSCFSGPRLCAEVNGRGHPVYFEFNCTFWDAEMRCLNSAEFFVHWCFIKMMVILMVISKCNEADS